MKLRPLGAGGASFLSKAAIACPSAARRPLLAGRCVAAAAVWAAGVAAGAQMVLVGVLLRVLTLVPRPVSVSHQKGGGAGVLCMCGMQACKCMSG